MTKKKTLAIIMALLLCTSVIIAYATINSSTEAKNYENPFVDVNESDWFYEDVRYVYENKLMSGTSNTEFSPTGSTTRGMIVTILWRLEGEPIEDGKIFDDVSKDTYYHKAVAWASNNIVSGYNEKIFAPDDTATREQLATIMYRYASYKKHDASKETELDKYIDKNQISEYAIQSIKWANANGIISGTSAETISPKDNVQRCQVAAILKRFCNNVSQIEGKGESTSVEESPKHESSIDVPKEENDNQHIDDIETEEIVNPSSPPTATETTTNDIYTSPTIVVGKAQAASGDEVQIAVDLKCNPGILGMTLTLYYDETKCSLQSVENGEAIKDFLDLTTSKTLGNGARFVWDGIELSEDDIKDGEILIMTFKINDNADEGSCPITLKYFENDIVDNNLVTVSPYIKNGEIIITK